jgi:predicted enzyme related to lactoylglutathione lyase
VSARCSCRRRISTAQSAVDDIEAEHTRLTGNGMVFTQPPSDIGTAVGVVFDDTIGNLQLSKRSQGENHDDAR